MQVALMNHSDRLNKMLNRVILLTPCTAEYEDGEDPEDVKDSLPTVGFWTSIGVYADYGPFWEDDLETLCNHEDVWEDECKDLRNYTGTETSVSSKNNDHWT